MHWLVLFLSWHFEYNPGQLSLGPIDVVVVSQSDDDGQNEKGEEGAKQLQNQLLEFAVRFGGTKVKGAQLVDLLGKSKYE